MPLQATHSVAELLPCHLVRRNGVSHELLDDLPYLVGGERQMLRLLRLAGELAPHLVPLRQLGLLVLKRTKDAESDTLKSKGWPRAAGIVGRSSDHLDTGGRAASTGPSPGAGGWISKLMPNEDFMETEQLWSDHIWTGSCHARRLEWRQMPGCPQAENDARHRREEGRRYHCACWWKGGPGRRERRPGWAMPGALQLENQGELAVDVEQQASRNGRVKLGRHALRLLPRDPPMLALLLLGLHVACYRGSPQPT